MGREVRRESLGCRGSRAAGRGITGGALCRGDEREAGRQPTAQMGVAERRGPGGGDVRRGTQRPVAGTPLLPSCPGYPIVTAQPGGLVSVPRSPRAVGLQTGSSF